jgi:membrane protease YdiL (CAAX protease family)
MEQIFLDCMTGLRHAPSLVKVSLFLVIWAIIWLPIAIPLARRLQWTPFQPLTVAQKLPLLASLYLIAPLVVWGTTTVEGTSLANYGLAWQPGLLISLLVGLGLGVGGLGLVFGAEGVLGWIQWHPEHYPRLRSVFLPVFVVGLWVGMTEELIFRGVFFNLLQQDYSIWMATILSSVIFALLHLLWERQETRFQLPGLGLMGIVLVGARLVDGGSLGLAWGLHAGWIWGLSVLDSAELLSYTGKGSQWMTGLGKQPLAGMAGISCLLGTGMVLWTLHQLFSFPQ